MPIKSRRDAVKRYEPVSLGRPATLEEPATDSPAAAALRHYHTSPAAAKEDKDKYNSMGVLHMHHRNARKTARLRQIIVVSVICLAIYCFLLAPEESLDGARWTNPESYAHQRHRAQREDGDHGESRRNAHSPELLSNRFLTEDQCRASFPGLLEQVDDEVAKGPVHLKRNPNNLGPLIARIRDGQVCHRNTEIERTKKCDKRQHANMQNISCTYYQRHGNPI